MTSAQEFDADVAIIGAGIAGSILAAVLARNGVKVLVFEAGTHPKFAIGESMILETSEIMRLIAEVFSVPEAEYFSAENFLPFIGSTHGVKRHFSYIFQSPGEPQNPDNVVQAVIPQRPYGHELHLYRQDSDYFYTSVAIRYGATVLQNTPISELDIGDDAVTINTAQHGRFKTRFVVDAGGFRSLLASQFELRDFDLKTHSRGLFTHMVDVPSFHSVSHSRSDFGIPYSLAEGTLHHVFEGGWLWVIPFDNHPQSSNPLCSVGLMLDPRIHPAPEGLSPEQEFNHFLDRYPGIACQLKGARAVRGWVRSGGRIQYSSKQLAGDRFALLGHAAGFIDPLFSKGLYTSLRSVLSLGQALISAHRAGEFRRSLFAEAEKTTLAYVRSNDRLVANAYKSFAHPKLWHQYSVLWILGAYLELVQLTTCRLKLKRSCPTEEQRLGFTMPELELVGGGYPKYRQLADQMDQLMDQLDTSDPTAIEDTATKMQELLTSTDWLPYSFRELSAGKKHLPKRKFTHRLLLNKGGVLGDRDYRQHFFPGISLPYLTYFMLRERFNYSVGAIRRRHRRLQKTRI